MTTTREMRSAGMPTGVTDPGRTLEAVSGRSPEARTREGWLEVVAECQSQINSLTAVQDAALARMAAIELEVDEDGTFAERPRCLGHVALDAPDVAAGVLGVSHVRAQERVRLAVRWAADGPAGTPSATGLAALHDAMAAGSLDWYSASVLADELDGAPPEVASAVLETLRPHLSDETAAQLRRRLRRAVARISPDLLRERTRRARAGSGLRRWVDEPGVDHWDGTFPSEDAAAAWAAIDALAQRHVADGACSGIERARAKALTDLVTGQATVDVVLTLTVPSSVAHNTEPVPAGLPGGHGFPRADGPGPRSPEVVPPAVDFVEVQGARPTEPVLVPRAWLQRLTRSPVTAAGAASRAARPGAPLVGTGHAVCASSSGALLDVFDELAGAAYRPIGRLTALVRARDGRCRFPGCSVSARFCDIDHVRPWPGGPTRAGNLMCLCRRHHRVKQRPEWRVRLHPDARAEWTDPTGRQRWTDPLDRLTAVILPAEPVTGPPASDAAASRGSAALMPAAGTRRSTEGERAGVADVLLEHLVGIAPRRPRASPTVDALHRPRRFDVDIGRLTPPCRHARRPRMGNTALDPPPF